MVEINTNYLDPQPDDWDALIMEAMSNDNSRISYCDIRHAHNGIKLNYSNPTIDHSVFAYNGSYGINMQNSSSEIYNVTSTHNQTGGIYCGVSNAVINNSIIAFNISYGIRSADSNPVLSYNDVYNNSTNYSGCTMGWGSLNANPLFAGLDDFLLTSNSPCIDSGDPNRPNDPDGSRSDMGAYFYGITYAETPAIAPIPEKYNLRMAYPNPFNAETTIEYWLPENSEITLEVYSVLGRKVADLMSETQEAGFRSVKWDAGQFSSGVYFVRMSAIGLANGHKYNAINKLMLIK